MEISKWRPLAVTVFVIGAGSGLSLQLPLELINVGVYCSFFTSPAVFVTILYVSTGYQLTDGEWYLLLYTNRLIYCCLLLRFGAAFA
jgi:hypothetical protein